MEHIFDEIKKELDRQREKWGEKRILPERTWIAVLLEEVGEVAKASLEHDPENYREELIQVAAVCISAIDSFDRDTAPFNTKQELMSESERFSIYHGDK